MSLELDVDCGSLQGCLQSFLLVALNFFVFCPHVGVTEVVGGFCDNVVCLIPREGW